MLSFGVTALPDPPYTRLVEVFQNGERNGFEYGWTYDSHILWQDSYATLPIAAVQTEKIKLGHCVTNPGIRDPTITASWYATLHDVSNGRAVMGIGRGDSSRRVVGLKPVKVDEFERRLVMIKDLMNGRQVEWNEQGAASSSGCARSCPTSRCTSPATGRARSVSPAASATA